MRRRSFGSVRIAFLDREMAITELTEAAHRLLDQDDRVIAIGLFGSLARGDALPSSDADLLIALREHPHPRWFDRIPEYSDPFTGTSLPVEVFPYTWDELVRMASQRGFLRTILRELIPLGGEADLWHRLREMGAET